MNTNVSELTADGYSCLETIQEIITKLGGSRETCLAIASLGNSHPDAHVLSELKHQSSLLADAGLTTSTEFDVGDYVNYKPGRGTLCCGGGSYGRAVVASMEPFILVSEGGDMLWSATVEPENFERVGEAKRKALLAVLDRFKRELYPGETEARECT
jgi:hypothetical protein